MMERCQTQDSTHIREANINTASKFYTLPFELFDTIAGLLRRADVLAQSLVCRRFHQQAFGRVFKDFCIDLVDIYRGDLDQLNAILEDTPFRHHVWNLEICGTTGGVYLGNTVVEKTFAAKLKSLLRSTLGGTNVQN